MVVLLTKFFGVTCQIGYLNNYLYLSAHFYSDCIDTLNEATTRSKNLYMAVNHIRSTDYTQNRKSYFYRRLVPGEHLINGSHHCSRR